ncbi:hypothetical protein TI01_2339 [Lysobacter sp. A03]|nr:hypothetical protein TI01_2339 [Lysobacter sp. A03]
MYRTAHYCVDRPRRAGDCRLVNGACAQCGYPDFRICHARNVPSTLSSGPMAAHATHVVGGTARGGGRNAAVRAHLDTQPQRAGVLPSRRSAGGCSLGRLHPAAGANRRWHWGDHRDNSRNGSDAGAGAR